MPNPPRPLSTLTCPGKLTRRCAALLLFAVAPLCANPVITEFMADNVSTLQDVDGDFSDWIEITNQGPGQIDLGGWHLTDDEIDLTKWSFPAGTLLGERASLVVFASGKNRALPNRELHTNFALSKGGEFLALVAPDGTTIGSRYAPYPSQEADISYGFGLGPAAVTTTLVNDNASARLLIPAGPVSDAWRGGSVFDDGAWEQVQLGIGYNTAGGPVIGGGGGQTVVAYSAAPGTSGTQAFGGALGMDFAVIEPISVRALGVFDDGSDGLGRNLEAQLWSRSGDGAGSVLAAETFTAGDPGTLEAGHRFKDLATPLTLEPGAYTMVGSGYGSGEENGNSGGNGDFTTSDDGGGLIQFVGTSRFGASPGAWPDTADGGGPARYGAGSFKYSSAGDGRIRTDVQDSMHGTNASALVRVPFTYAGPEQATALQLEIAYDDGVAVWLNGNLLVSRNAPVAPAWNSPATAEGNTVETFALPGNLLQLGDNVLAIQGLNRTLNDNDFIVSVRLDAQFSRFERLYFSAPTPRNPNGIGEQGTGVVINEIHYDPESNTAPAEFVELYNAGAQTVELAGWTLSNAVDYTFPANSSLAPDGYLLIVLDRVDFAAQFGNLPVLGQFTGRLSNAGDNVELRDDLGTLVDRVDYGVGAPWPVAGEEPYPSIQLLHPGQDNDLAGSWRAAPPTPGALNSVFAIDTPPQVRQVRHEPQAPVSDEEVVVTCKVTDPDGVASVILEYQPVRPGGYIRQSDAAFANWTQVAMAPDPAEGSLFTVTLPASLQNHRRLIRYRIVAEDTFGESVTVPLPSDPSVNFAYFTYDGVPAWQGAIIPGQTPLLDFSAETMDTLPIYHLIAQESDIVASQYNTSFNDKVYRFEGALVYDGVVYDHIRYRIRGHGSTYNTGKNKWKLKFNRGRFFEIRDNYGQPRREKVRTLNWSALSSPWNPANRGAAGLDEALAFRLWQLAGMPAANTNYFQLRIIDGAREANPADQFDGDTWGLYLTIEQADRRFLDERNLPDGNTFNMHFGSSNILNQAYGQLSNRSDLFAFTGTGSGGYNRNPVQPVSWWDRRVDLESYFSYRAVIEAVNHSDLRDQENSILYYNPEARLWTMIPWDVDLLYEEFDRWGPNAVQSPAALEQFRKSLTHPEINLRFQNRARELQDLLLNRDQGWTLIDELSTVLGSVNGSLGMAELDAARWNRDARTRRVEGSSPDSNRYFFMNPYQSTRFPQHRRTLISTDFPGMTDWVKQFIIRTGFGGGRLDDMIRDSEIPDTPTIAYVGSPGYPTDGLVFASSPFAPGSGGAGFSHMEWRVGEISNPDVAGYQEGAAWIYEVEETWSSGELSAFENEMAIPPIAVEVGRTYRARVRHRGDDGRWSHWSAPAEFTTIDPDLQPYLEGLVISEIMYNPADDEQDLEYLELRNIGAAPLDLTDVRFSAGIEFAFAGSQVTSLNPGETVLVVRNQAAFETEYGAAHQIAGEYRFAPSNNLANNGETLTLAFGADSVIRSFAFSDTTPWPTAPDGLGYSLVLIAPASNPDHSLAANWRSSALPGGNPGTSDAYALFAGDPNSDLDRDGLTDFFEHAVGGDPAIAEFELLPRASVESIEVDGEFARYLTVTVQRNLGADDVELSAQVSQDLLNWEGGPGFTVFVRETPKGDGTSTVTWRSADPIASSRVEFLRVVALGRP